MLIHSTHPSHPTHAAQHDLDTPAPLLSWEEADIPGSKPYMADEVIIPSHRRWLAFSRREDGCVLLVRVEDGPATRVWFTQHTQHLVLDHLKSLAHKLHPWPGEDAHLLDVARCAELAGGLPASVVEILKHRMRFADAWDGEGATDGLYAEAVELAQKLFEHMGGFHSAGPQFPFDAEGEATDGGLREAFDAQFDAWSEEVQLDLRALVLRVMDEFPSLRLVSAPTTDVDDRCEPSFSLAAWITPYNAGDTISEEQLNAIEKRFELVAKDFKALASLSFTAELGANTIDPADFIEQGERTLFHRVDLSLRACVDIPDNDY
jgi:hypothetical protein